MESSIETVVAMHRMLDMSEDEANVQIYRDELAQPAEK